MKGEIMQRLAAVLAALNTIPVSGKQNLSNLVGSISVIEEIIGMLSETEATTATAK